MPTLSNWLNKDKVQYVESVSDWKEAIQIAARPLLAEGAISPAYIESIIKQKEDIGPYFVIAPRIAMPHTRPEHGANALGLSILKLGQAVEFQSEDNDPVDAIFMFSAPDSNSHIEMISQLAEVLSDDEVMQQIFNVESAAALQAILLSEASASC
ncbi:PTS sugar transporter subunit IIA [Kluyvera genomosp. 1]|uniref:PTS sugar transporter subunit IIA n=1 Tax=Kluyvera genomosp. 1 TaxID=2774053 RepID=UPI000692255B|nr:PTS sugar transporter subunit IIA [Kluyvera genomosp. 1]